jgi:hypothetical protein
LLHSTFEKTVLAANRSTLLDIMLRSPHKRIL